MTDVSKPNVENVPQVHVQASTRLFRRGLAIAVAFAPAIMGCVTVKAADKEPPVRGVVKAVNQASFSTDIAMRIVRLPFREGQRFQKGDLLAEFDCRRQAGELQAVSGVVKEAELNVASSLSLDKFGAVGKNDIEIARARLEKAKGEMTSLKARVLDCKVNAPFSGRVSEAPLRILEYTAPQRPYLAIVEDNNYEIEMIISSSMLAAIALEQPLTFRVDELPDGPVKAAIKAVGAVVDPVSKTAKVFAAVISAPPALTGGMSGTAHFLAKGK